MEHRIEDLIRMERSEPRRYLPIADGTLYALVLASVVFAIVLSYDLSDRFHFPRVYAQLALYGFLGLIGYWVYRCRLLAFRYTLTNRSLTIERLVGRKIRQEAEIRLSDILAIECTEPQTKNGAKRLHAATGRDVRTLIVLDGEIRKTLILSFSDDFLKELNQQWETNR